MVNPTCFECGDKMEQTGRLTWYCPSCDVCSECGCPNADGLIHYIGCPIAEAEDKEIEYDLDQYVMLRN